MNPLNRSLCLIVAVLFSLVFSGGRCLAEPSSRSASDRWHIVFTLVKLGSAVEQVKETPASFRAKSPVLCRRAIVATVFPKHPVLCGYHPQPAHC